MKSIRCILLVGLLLGSAAAAIAVPPSKRTYTAPALRTTEEFQKLKTGDTIAMVCTQCSSVTVQTIENTAQAMALCKEGESIVCGSCKQAVKVVRRGPPAQALSRTEVRYVNEKGEDCMFVVKLDK